MTVVSVKYSGERKTLGKEIYVFIQVVRIYEQPGYMSKMTWLSDDVYRSYGTNF